MYELGSINEYMPPQIVSVLKKKTYPLLENAHRPPHTSTQVLSMVSPYAGLYDEGAGDIGSATRLRA